MNGTSPHAHARHRKHAFLWLHAWTKAAAPASEAPFVKRPRFGFIFQGNKRGLSQLRKSPSGFSRRPRKLVSVGRVSGIIGTRCHLKKRLLRLVRFESDATNLDSVSDPKWVIGEVGYRNRVGLDFR